jgi:hypothetical protein
MAYTTIGAQVLIKIRDRLLVGKVVKMPFV